MKILLRVVLAIIFFCVGFVVIVVASWNLRKDEALNPELASIIAPRLEPVREANGFFVYAGMHAASGKDPATVGQEFVALLNAHKAEPGKPEFAPPPDLFGTPLDWSPKESTRICNWQRTPCLHIYRESPATPMAQTANAELLARYFAMQAKPHFFNPLKPEALASAGKVALLAKSAELADAIAVRGLTSTEFGEQALNAYVTDMRYWRWQLTNAGSVSERTITESILRRKLILLSEVMRAQPTIAASPRFAEMTKPLSAEERSMLRTMHGELRYTNTVVTNLAREQCLWATSLWDRARCAVGGGGALKPNSTMNAIYRDWMAMHQRIEESPGATAAILTAAKNEPTADTSARATSGTLFFNPQGAQLQATIGQATVLAPFYASSVDLDTHFRLIEAQRQIIASGSADIAAASTALPESLRDPSTQKPFVWDAKARTLSFARIVPNKDEPRVSVKF